MNTRTMFLIGSGVSKYYNDKVLLLLLLTVKMYNNDLSPSTLFKILKYSCAQLIISVLETATKVYSSITLMI